jgi:hypothetical protein
MLRELRMYAELDGFLSRDFAGDMAPPMDLGLAAAAEYVSEQVDIVDARPVQARAVPETEFFAEHGFALLQHQTEVLDWQRELASLYLPEITELIRDRLFPERRIEILRGSITMRRGPNERYYATRIHADGPLSADRYALNVGAVGGVAALDNWRAHYAREDVAGFVSIGFWRTTNMRHPLQHMPLAICDPHSLDPGDILPTTSRTIAPAGRTTHHLVLRHGPGQAWYYYPRMAGDEVVAMKACEFWKDDPGAPPQNVFHAAFHHPDTPADAERRQSFDHRMGVMILRD